MSSPQSLPRRTPRGHLFRGLAWGTLIALVAVAAYLTREQYPPPKPPPVAAAAANLPRGGEIPAVQKAIHDSVCLIAAAGPAGKQTLGTGIVVTADGGVLTCLHVMSLATEATARFSDGTQTEILGYRAVWPQFDLALVQLQTGSDQTWTPIKLAIDPPRGRPRMISAGHPQGTEFDARDGHFSQILTTTQMTPEVRGFAAALTPGQADVHWLQHTALLQAGHSGGPVLNELGLMLGINVWVDETRQTSYAIANQDVQPLLATLPTEIVKLETHARPAVRKQAERWRISADQLLKVFDHGRAMQWQPATGDDYDVLQQLAIGLTLAHDSKLLTATGRSEKHIEELARAGDKIVAALRRERWRSAGQLLLMNEHAAIALTQPAGGFWGCVRIEKQLAADEASARLLTTLSGFEQSIILELGGTLQPPQVGEQWIVVGMVQAPTNAVRTKEIPLVTSYVLFPLEKS